MLKPEKDIACILENVRECYAQLETEYELQRAMLHEKNLWNARLHDELDTLTSELTRLKGAIRSIRKRMVGGMITEVGETLTDVLDAVRDIVCFDDDPCDHDYQEFGPSERIDGSAVLCIKCGRIHPNHLKEISGNG